MYHYFREKIIKSEFLGIYLVYFLSVKNKYIVGETFLKNTYSWHNTISYLGYILDRIASKQWRIY